MKVHGSWSRQIKYYTFSWILYGSSRTGQHGSMEFNMLLPWISEEPYWSRSIKYRLPVTWPQSDLPKYGPLRPRQNGHHFADDIFKWMFLNENVWIPVIFSLKFVPQGPINNIPALVQIMAWRRPGDKPLFGPMMVRLPTHICVTRPQWVKVCKRYGWLIFHTRNASSTNWKTHM